VKRRELRGGSRAGPAVKVPRPSTGRYHRTRVGHAPDASRLPVVLVQVKASSRFGHARPQAPHRREGVQDYRGDKACTWRTRAPGRRRCPSE
jgi:hypothetical protein